MVIPKGYFSIVCIYYLTLNALLFLLLLFESHCWVLGKIFLVCFPHILTVLILAEISVFGDSTKFWFFVYSKTSICFFNNSIGSNFSPFFKKITFIGTYNSNSAIQAVQCNNSSRLHMLYIVMQTKPLAHINQLFQFDHLSYCYLKSWSYLTEITLP